MTAAVTDNDVSAVTVTESDGATAVSEVGPSSDTYTIVLDTEPAADVTITVGPDAQTDVGAGAGASIDLVFTNGDWDSPQTVTVTAVDDDVDEASPHTSTITHTAVSADANYEGIAISDVTAVITDNDSAGVSIVESDGSTEVSEQGPTSDYYTIVLNTEPIADVTIVVDPDDQADVGAGAGVAISLTFTSADWDVPQTLTVTAEDDGALEGNHTATITHHANSAAPKYDAVSIPDVVATVIDNDVPGVTISLTGGSTAISESGTLIDTYTVVLNSQPTANVSVEIAPSAEVNVGAGGGVATILTFTPSTWHTSQLVVVSAVDNSVAQDSPRTVTIAHSTASDDINYDGIVVQSINVSIVDDDTPAVTIEETHGATIVRWDGPRSDSYSLVLDSKPVADVVITITIENMGIGDAKTGGSIQRTFTPDNWNVPQSVTVTALDGQFEAEEDSLTVLHTVGSDDPRYDATEVRAVTVHVVLPGSGGDDTRGPIESVWPILPALPVPVCGIPLPFPILATCLGLGSLRVGLRRRNNRRRTS